MARTRLAQLRAGLRVGFYTRWDLADLAQGRAVMWMQPNDWNNNVVALTGPLYRYRAFDEMNEGIIGWLLQ